MTIAKSTFLRYPMGRKFQQIALSRTVKEIESILCFAILGKNSKIQNGRHMWEEKNFWKLPRVHCSDTLWVENFDEIALSHTVKEIEANLCFAIFGKNSKIQNGHHFWGGEIFLKIAKSAFLRYPVGRKSRTVKEIEAILCLKSTPCNHLLSSLSEWLY